MILGTFLCAMALAVDGDTLRCAGIGRVRLAAIDAPELPGHCRRGRQCAPGDPHAAAFVLSAFVTDEQVVCEQVDADPSRAGFQEGDRWGRPVARCLSYLTNGTIDLSDEMLRLDLVNPL